ncbi:diguanylate cyclase [Mycoplasmatota bacterium WC44]
MNLSISLILITLGFVSFIPVKNLYGYRNDNRYRCLKYLINTTFLWTILIFLERILENVEMVYYIHLMGYPLKLLLSAFMFCTIMNYIGRKIPKIIYIVFFLLFTIDLMFSITNNQSQLMLDLTIGEITTKYDVFSAINGPLFIYHVVIAYSILLGAVGILYYHVSRNRNVRHYKMISRTMAYSTVIVLIVSMTQVFFVKTDIDITYISLVIFSFTLYRVIYMKDMLFNLKTSGRVQILSNMREMYILTDNNETIVEVSNILLDKYNLSELDVLGKSLQSLYKELKQYVIFHDDYDIDEDNDDSNKKHYHIKKKKFILSGMDSFGYMILLYDESQVINLLRELNRLSNYDDMTGLHNRNYIENNISSFDENHPSVGVVSLDLNGLKANNDYIGHERGDYLLKELSNNIKIVMSDYGEHVSARIGGDEFIIVLFNASTQVLDEIKDKILDLCNSDNLLDMISVSIGTSIRTSDESIHKLIQLADISMYEMKKVTSKDYSKKLVEEITKSDKYIR